MKERDMVKLGLRHWDKEGEMQVRGTYFEEGICDEEGEGNKCWRANKGV